MIIRKDNRATAVIPESIAEAIMRIGGTNVYGEPLYRLILAQDRYTLAAGEWNEWPEGATLDDISGLGIGEMREMVQEGKAEQEINEFLQSRLQVKPDSVTVGMKEIPVYGYEGWVLEKWKPGSNYGAPSDWEQYKFHGEMALGPYPEYGDYEYCAGPTPYMLTETQIEEAIRFDMKQIDQKSGNPRQRVLLLLQRREIALAKKKKDRKSVIESVLKYGSLGNLRNRLSLGAGRVRNELAKQAGITEHMGN